MFCSRFKSKGKCCDVIIDGGSTDNLVSKEMVSKLKLKREKHPQPYQIAWVQDDHKVLVSEQCLVNFKIGNHNDEDLCDIIRMDVYHLLLGSLWHFNRHAIHDGHANTYSLTKDGICQKLKPLIKEGEKVCNSARVCHVDGRNFLDGMKHQHMCYALIPRKDKEGSSEVFD